MQNYEVTVSMRLHGAFNVEAESEDEAERIVGAKLKSGEITLDQMEVADETHIDCVTDGSDKDGVDEGFICPLHQCPCDQECSWAEKANCEYYQGLSATR